MNPRLYHRDHAARLDHLGAADKSPSAGWPQQVDLELHGHDCRAGRREGPAGCARRVVHHRRKNSGVYQALSLGMTLGYNQFGLSPTTADIGQLQAQMRDEGNLSELRTEPLDLPFVEIAAIRRRDLLLFDHNCAW